MRQIIVAWFEGDLDKLFQRWNIPSGVPHNRESDNKIRITFTNGNINEFYRLEQLACEAGIEVTATFRASDFSHDECLNAKLLFLQSLCTESLEVVQPMPITEKIKSMQQTDEIIVVSRQPITTQIVLTCTNLLLFHTDLVKSLKQSGIAKGLREISVTMNDPDDNKIGDWVWVTSNSDLGKPVTQRRFIKGFDGKNRNDEDFCFSSHYGPDIVFVSQSVFRFLDALPEDKKGDIYFEPVELL